MKKTKKLVESVKIGSCTLRNRMVLSPMLTCSGNEDNSISDVTVRYYTERAKGGIGAVITEYFYVDDKASKARGLQLANTDDSFLPGMKKLASDVKKNNSAVIMQLCHAGRQTKEKWINMQPVAPSAISNLGTMPRELTVEEIIGIEDAFQAAAERAVKADFDGVEIHGANGYLLNSFASGATNKRTDIYGGSWDNMIRFPIETVEKVRQAIGPDKILGYRVSGSDFLDDGITEDQLRVFAKRLESSGVDYIHVSGGMQESWYYVVQPMYIPNAILTEFSAIVKEIVNIPVISVGSHTVETAEETLNSDKADIIAFGRALICDPDLPKKIIEGREEDIRPCVRCNGGCVGHTKNNEQILCELNPIIGRWDWEYFTKPKGGKKKKIIIIGGGISGLESARLAALRGHEVSVYEKTGLLGGHLVEGTIPNFKESLGRFLKWQKKQLNDLNVNIHLNTLITSEEVKKMNADIVVAATGSKFIEPPFFVDSSDMMMADEALLNAYRVHEPVVIVGGGIVGSETALYFANELNKKVKLIEAMDDILLTGENSINREAMIKCLTDSGAEIHTGLKVERIIDRKVLCADKYNNRSEIEAGSVVIALGLKPGKDTTSVFEDVAPVVLHAGDCVEVRNIVGAVEDAFQIANKYFV